MSNWKTLFNVIDSYFANDVKVVLKSFEFHHSEESKTCEPFNCNFTEHLLNSDYKRVELVFWFYAKTKSDKKQVADGNPTRESSLFKHTAHHLGFDSEYKHFDRENSRVSVRIIDNRS